MTIEQADKVDLVAIDEKNKVAVLYIVDPFPWKAQDGAEKDDEQFELEHLFRLQEKFNAYLEFVQSGQLAEQFPAAEGCNVVIRVRGRYALSENAERFLQMAAGPLGEAGCELGFERFEADPEEA